MSLGAGGYCRAGGHAASLSCAKTTSGCRVQGQGGGAARDQAGQGDGADSVSRSCGESPSGNRDLDSKAPKGAD